MLDHSFLVKITSVRELNFSQWACRRFLSFGTRHRVASVVSGELSASIFRGAQEEATRSYRTIVSVHQPVQCPISEAKKVE